MFPRLIYKILSLDEWNQFRAGGAFAGAKVDLEDGFIHFSTATQLAETARKHFAGRAGLVLVAVDSARLGPALRYEVSRGGALFPHLYATLSIDDVVWDRPLGLDAAGVPEIGLLPADEADPLT